MRLAVGGGQPLFTLGLLMFAFLLVDLLSLLWSPSTNIDIFMQTCWWPLSDHWSLHLTSPHLPECMWCGGLKAHWSYLPYGCALYFWAKDNKIYRCLTNWQGRRSRKHDIYPCALLSGTSMLFSFAAISAVHVCNVLTPERPGHCSELYSN